MMPSVEEQLLAFIEQLDAPNEVTGKKEREPAFIRCTDIEKHLLNWAEKKRGIYFEIVACFLKRAENCEESIDVDDMAALFISIHPNYEEDEARRMFMNNFRMLCSSSKSGYGQLFCYDKRNKTVTVVEEERSFLAGIADRFALPHQTISG